MFKKYGGYCPGALDFAGGGYELFRLCYCAYCVEFEVLKASKACRKEDNYKALKEGERVCARCESEALHENLGWRCQGHGVEGRVTRWSALSAPHCHGKWLRAQAEPDSTCVARTCKDQYDFIFV
ncbi:hypothetical protein NQ317_002428 [Molorchus minor]|uniref:SBSPON-like C-terminal domain-containing protein n=1 Tax=Molorchus minor TaxID=1323400 RepID=A0ABQ9J0C3_9CUCU|nr:hypothetical protein NQ317_002428 [Molorchus minor]